MSRRRWILVFSLVTVALFSGWFLDRLGPKTEAPTQSARHVPDYYVENFTTTTMDENGFPRRRVTADYMAHFPDTDTHELRLKRVQGGRILEGVRLQKPIMQLDL